MRSATILDVLRAVTRVARGHREVHAWWYAPPQRLHIAGAEASTPPTPEVAIDVPASADVDEATLERELRDILGVPRIRVRRYRGTHEPRTLFRLVTTGGAQ